MKREFIEELIFPAIQANAIYEVRFSDDLRPYLAFGLIPAFLPSDRTSTFSVLHWPALSLLAV